MAADAVCVPTTTMVVCIWHHGQQRYGCHTQQQHGKLGPASKCLRDVSPAVENRTRCRAANRYGVDAAHSHTVLLVLQRLLVGAYQLAGALRRPTHTRSLLCGSHMQNTTKRLRSRTHAVLSHKTQQAPKPLLPASAVTHLPLRMSPSNSSSTISDAPTYRNVPVAKHDSARCTIGLTSRTNMPARMAQGATNVKGPTYSVICAEGQAPQAQNTERTHQHNY